MRAPGRQRWCRRASGTGRRTALLGPANNWACCHTVNIATMVEGFAASDGRRNAKVRETPMERWTVRSRLAVVVGLGIASYLPLLAFAQAPKPAAQPVQLAQRPLAQRPAIRGVPRAPGPEARGDDELSLDGVFLPRIALPSAAWKWLSRCSKIAALAKAFACWVRCWKTPRISSSSRIPTSRSTAV